MDDALRSYLGRHLADGETHYTTRPGIIPLRERIGELLGRVGTANEVVVTASEGESLYVTLLSLHAKPGSVVVTNDAGDHGRLFDWMQIETVPADHERAADAIASLVRGNDQPPATASRPTITAIGSRLPAPGAHIDADGIIIGDLNGVPGLDHFHLGFAVGPPERIKGIMTWKQALSICTAAPSQRVALRQLSSAHAGASGA
jgi:DNA-binding transcriptional MocR family regulator